MCVCVCVYRIKRVQSRKRVKVRLFVLWNGPRPSGIFFPFWPRAACNHHNLHRLRAIRSFYRAETDSKRARERTLSNPVCPLNPRLLDSSNPFNPMNLATHNVSSLRRTQLPPPSLAILPRLFVEIKRDEYNINGRVSRDGKEEAFQSGIEMKSFCPARALFPGGKCRRGRRERGAEYAFDENDGFYYTAQRIIIIVIIIIIIIVIIITGASSVGSLPWSRDL